jgi:hypothetical protein
MLWLDFHRRGKRGGAAAAAQAQQRETMKRILD